METSSADTGSSAMISRGLRASARAMPMRWRWPPENSCGYRAAWLGDSPTMRISSPTRSRASRPPFTIPCTVNTSVSIVRTLNRGLRLE